MALFRHYSAQPSSPARLGTHTLKETFMCYWNTAPTLHCDELFRGDDLSAHLRAFHGIRGADKSRVRCLWKNCGQELNKESLSRHVEEKHLGIVYPCETCGKSYSRDNTLNKHRTTCSGSRK